MIKSLFSFSRKERLGIIGLSSIILILLGISFYIRNSTRTEIKLDAEKLNLAWQKLQATPDTDPIQIGDKELFYFDPNTLDSMGFIRLGLSARSTRYLLNWRNKGKRFYKKEDLKALYSLSDEAYERLAPFIQIKEAKKEPYYRAYENLPPLPERVNLNTVDSITLVRLNGIGAFLAHKIIERRRALGGYIKHEQLLELYPFPDTTYAHLKERLIIRPEEIHKIKLNSCSEEQLALHPYIGEKMAKNILLWRKGLNKYQNIEQLRQVPLINEEKYRKIAIYCTID